MSKARSLSLKKYLVGSTGKSAQAGRDQVQVNDERERVSKLRKCFLLRM